MTQVAVDHKFVSAKADGPDPTLVQPSKWNQDHNFTGGSDGQILVRDSVQTNGANWVSAASTIVLRSYLAGMGLSNDSGTPTTVLDVAAGLATSDDNTTAIVLAAITGSISGTWVVGSGNNKLDTGTIGASTWYHVWAIIRPDTGVTDILFSLSATAPTMPTNYTKKRRIGSFRTNGSSQIIAFIQDGDNFTWAATVLDINVTNPGTAAVTRTLTVPTGVNVISLVHIQGNATAATVYLLSDLAVTDEAPSLTAAPLGHTFQPTGGTSVVHGGIPVRTNTSAQIRSRQSTSAVGDPFRIVTYGWVDSRGRNA